MKKHTRKTQRQTTDLTEKFTTRRMDLTEKFTSNVTTQRDKQRKRNKGDTMELNIRTTQLIIIKIQPRKKKLTEFNFGY